MGDDIDGFRRVLAGYKSTIIIALTDANLRRSSITTEGLGTYRELIETVTDDLETHLKSIDEKLETIIGDTETGPGPDATELRRIKEERTSTQKCLQICAQLSDHINQIQLTPERKGSSPGRSDPASVSERLTTDGLKECKDSLALTAAKLEKHMRDLIDLFVAKSKAAKISNEELADLARLRDEWETARQCMDICSKADIHLKENISTIENYATGDAVQFMVSTDGNIINGKNQGLGWRTRQFGGHLSDASLQKISHDFSILSLQNTGVDSSSSRGKAPSVPDDGMEHKPASVYQKRYGQGHTLPSSTAADSSMPSTGSAGNGLSSSLKG